MSGVQTLIDEVEASFRTGTASSRAETLRRITDLFLAGDGLLEAALGAEELASIRVLVVVDDGSLRVSAGSFRTPELRDRVAVTPGNCIDLCTLLSRLVDARLGDPDQGAHVPGKLLDDRAVVDVEGDAIHGPLQPRLEHRPHARWSVFGAYGRRGDYDELRVIGLE